METWRYDWRQLFCLWAVCARSAQGCMFTEPWGMPPTADAMTIKRGVVYNPTIHHGYLLEKNRHPGCRQPWPLLSPIGPPRPFCLRVCIDRAMGDAPDHRRHENLAGVDVLPNNPPTLIFYKIIRHPGHRQPWSPPPPMGCPWPFRSRACVDRAMGNAPYCRHHENWAWGGVKLNNPPWIFVRNRRHSGRRQGRDRRPLPPVPCKSSGGLFSILFILINILFILINPSCPHVLVSQHQQQSTIIWLVLVW